MKVLDNLSSELAQTIFRYVTPQDLNSLSLANKWCRTQAIAVKYQTLQLSQLDSHFDHFLQLLADPSVPQLVHNFVFNGSVLSMHPRLASFKRCIRSKPENIGLLEASSGTNTYTREEEQALYDKFKSLRKEVRPHNNKLWIQRNEKLSLLLSQLKTIKHLVLVTGDNPSNGEQHVCSTVDIQPSRIFKAAGIRDNMLVATEHHLWQVMGRQGTMILQAVRQSKISIEKIVLRTLFWNEWDEAKSWTHFTSCRAITMAVSDVMDQMVELQPSQKANRHCQLGRMIGAATNLVELALEFERTESMLLVDASAILSEIPGQHLQRLELSHCTIMQGPQFLQALGCYKNLNTLILIEMNIHNDAEDAWPLFFLYMRETRTQYLRGLSRLILKGRFCHAVQQDQLPMWDMSIPFRICPSAEQISNLAEEVIAWILGNSIETPFPQNQTPGPSSAWWEDALLEDHYENQVCEFQGCTETAVFLSMWQTRPTPAALRIFTKCQSCDHIKDQGDWDDPW